MTELNRCTLPPDSLTEYVVINNRLKNPQTSNIKALAIVSTTITEKLPNLLLKQMLVGSPVDPLRQLKSVSYNVP